MAPWTDLAEWTGREVPGSLWAKLLRDSRAPTLLDGFEPSTLEFIAELELVHASKRIALPSPSTVGGTGDEAL